MSKKLIAVASAAALALSALVAAPATALGPFDVTATKASTGSMADTNGSTGDLEHTINVPSQDVLRFADGTYTTAAPTSTGTLLRYVVETPLGGAAVSVTAAGGGAKLISKAQFDKLSEQTTASGTATLSITSDSSGDVTFYAYTTSTADSTITVSSAGASKILYLKGVSPKTNSYKLNFTAAPLSSAIGGKITFTGTITDMFGNLMKSVETADLTVTGLGGNLSAINNADFAQNLTTSVITFDAINRSTTGSAAMSISMANTLAPTAGTPTKITAFGTPVGTQFFNVNAIDLSAQVTALTAQVAALTADYNALATRWNKKVDSKRRVFNKVPLK
jgi:hypothetical protein